MSSSNSLLAEAIDAEDKEACNAQFAEILAEQTSLKKQKEAILQSSTDADRVCTRMKQADASRRERRIRRSQNGTKTPSGRS